METIVNVPTNTLHASRQKLERKLFHFDFTVDKRTVYVVRAVRVRTLKN